MKQLICFQLRRIIRQKAFWIFLIGMLVMTINSAIELRRNLEDFYAVTYGGGLFPIYIMQGQIVLIMPLFMSIIVAYLVNGERTSGMLKQPLLQGITKRELLDSKIIVLIITSFVFITILLLSSYIVSMSAWGSGVLARENVLRCLIQYALVLIPFVTLSIFLILLSLYTANAAATIGVMLFIVLFDSLLNQFFISVISKVSFLYYIYAYSSYNNTVLENWMIFRGILICLVTAIILYLLAAVKIQRMEYA